MAKRVNYPSDCVVVVPRKTKAHGRFGGEATVGNSFNLGGASNPYYLYLNSIIIRFATAVFGTKHATEILISDSCFFIIMFLPLCDTCCYYVSLVRYLLLCFSCAIFVGGFSNMWHVAAHQSTISRSVWSNFGFWFEPRLLFKISRHTIVPSLTLHPRSQLLFVATILNTLNQH